MHQIHGYKTVDLFTPFKVGNFSNRKKCEILGSNVNTQFHYNANQNSLRPSFIAYRYRPPQGCSNGKTPREEKVKDIKETKYKLRTCYHVLKMHIPPSNPAEK
jgi:hypothetical protein